MVYELAAGLPILCPKRFLSDQVIDQHHCLTDFLPSKRGQSDSRWNRIGFIENSCVLEKAARIMETEIDSVNIVANRRPVEAEIPEEGIGK